MRERVRSEELKMFRFNILVMREEKKMSFKHIAKVLNKDYSTIVYHYRAVAQNPQYSREFGGKKKKPVVEERVVEKRVEYVEPERNPGKTYAEYLEQSCQETRRRYNALFHKWRS